MTRHALVGLTAAAVILLSAGPAWSLWSTVGSGTATGTATALTQPAAPSASGQSATSVAVNGPLPATQLPGTTYDIVRNGSAVVCSPTASPYACSDTGLTASTTYSYAVVAKLGAWRSTSPAGTGTTLCGGPDTFVVGAPTQVTAGAAFTVTLTAKACNGSTDTAFAGAKTLALSGLATSPSGQVPTYPTTATFTSGVATVSVTAFDAEAPTLTATSGVVTGTDPLTVVAGAPNSLSFNGATNGGPVVLTCTAPSATRTCTQSTAVSTGNKRTWSATVGLTDLWGNVATATTATTVTFSGGTTVDGQLTIAAGSTETTLYSYSLPRTGTSTLRAFTSMLSLTVTGAG